MCGLDNAMYFSVSCCDVFNAYLPHRFVLVLDGKVTVTPATGGGEKVELGHNDYVYFPPGDKSRLTSGAGAGILVWERIYSLKGSPVFFHGHVEDSALLPTAGEVFELRKLLPQVCALCAMITSH